MPTHAVIQHRSNALSAEEIQQIETVVIQSQSMASETTTVAPTCKPFAFDGREL